MPGTSIIVGLPAGDDPAALRRSVPSVLAQTWPHGVELVVVEDRGDTRTTEVLRELTERHSTVEVMRGSGGRAAAWQALLERADERPVAWLETGDVWQPVKLERQMEALAAAEAEAPGPICCLTPVRRLDDGATAGSPGDTGDEASTLLGRASHLATFTEAGDDPDHESAALARFVAAGGRVVDTGDDVPLVTLVGGAPPARVRARPSARTTSSGPGPLRRLGRWLGRREEPPGRRDLRTAPAPAAPPAPPSSPDGELRRVERDARAGDWHAAVSGWETIAARVGRDLMTVETYRLLAQAFRALGRYEEAIGLAAEGARQHDDPLPLHKELSKSRAAATDWDTAVRVEPDVHDQTRAPSGQVTTLGALAGGDGPVAGWVETDASRPVEVSLHVNDLTVATTHAIRDDATTGRSTFQLSAEQLHEYLGDRDEITVVTSGRTLPIGGTGVRVTVTTGYASRVEELAARIERGDVFTKFGQLRRGNTPKRKRQVLARYEEVADVLAEHGRVAQPFFGNLLGAVREHGFIPHDVGGFDMGYLSAAAEPDEVRAELLAICGTLLERGFHLRASPWSVMVRRRASDGLFVDLNYAWFDPDGRLGLSYGWRHPRVTERAAYVVPRDVPLVDRLVAVPGNAEAVLAQVYGPSWAVPDQGFEPGVELLRDVDYLLTSTELDALSERAPDQVVIEAVLDEQGETVWLIGP